MCRIFVFFPCKVLSGFIGVFRAVRKAFLFLTFMCGFAAVAAQAQEPAPAVRAVDPTVQVERTEEQLVSETICPAMQDDETYNAKGMIFYKKIVAGDDGWVFRTGTDFRSDFKMHPQTIRYMKKLQDAFTAKGILFVYLVPPTRGIAQGNHVNGDDVESKDFRSIRADASAGYQAMLKTMQGAGINVVGFPGLVDGKAYFYKRDHHWNPEGARLAARRTAAFIKASPVYASIPKVPFVTRDVGAYDYTGPFGEIIYPVCKLVLPSEKTDRYETTRGAQASDSDALFSDDVFPEIALVGTSNSANDPSVANFDGFLKEALATDVYNASIIGAGIDAPLLAYLNSDAYRAHKPKVVIWETPGYYNQNFMHSRIYRQAIPGVFGDCAENPVAERKGREVNGAEIDVISGLGGHKIVGSQYYVTLRFSGVIKKPVHISLKYSHYTDSYKVTRPPRYPYDGVYYMLLKDMKAGSLDSVRLKLPDEAVGQKLDVRVCKLPASVTASKK